MDGSKAPGYQASASRVLIGNGSMYRSLIVVVSEKTHKVRNEIVMQIFPNMALVLSLVTLVLLVARTKLVAQVA